MTHPASRRNAARGALVVLLIVGACMIAGSRAARAATPTSGWWSKTQSSAIAQVAPAAAVTGSDLVVGSDPSGPNAEAAVRFDATGSRGGTLTIAVAPGGAVGSPSVAACPAASAWTPASGGPWEDRPAAKCPAAPPIGRLADDGTSITFVLPADLQTAPGQYDLVLLPAATTASTFRLTLRPPGEASFVPSRAPAPVTTAAPARPATPPTTVAPTGEALRGNRSAASTLPAVAPPSPVRASAPSVAAAPTSGASVLPPPPHIRPHHASRPFLAVFAPALLLLVAAAFVVAARSARRAFGVAAWRRYRPILRFAAKQRGGWVAIVVLTIVSSAIGLLSPWPLKVLADRVLVGGPTGSRGTLIAVVAIAMFVLSIGGSAVDGALSYTWTRISQRMVYDVGAAALEKAERRSISFHRSTAVGDLMSRVVGDSWVLTTITANALVGPAHALVMAVGILVVLLRLDVELAIIAALAAPAIAFTSVMLGRLIRRTAAARRQAEADVDVHVQRILSGIHVVQAFGQEDREQSRFRSLTSSAIRADRWTALVQNINQLGSGLVLAVGGGVVLWLAARRVLAHELTVGALLVFVSYVRVLQGQLKALAGAYGTLQSARASADRLLEVLDAEPEVVDRPGALVLESVRGGVVLDDVTFGYRPGEPVLQGVSLTAQPGETVALVGSSGAGKTTLTSLLIRFFDPWSGRILVDDHDLRDVQLASLRQHIAIVLQEPFLFPISIADNIAYGRPDASRAEVIAAAEAANAHEFVSALPDGYDTVVGERGATLSGGQRQRLAIARALLKDAPILILDEPTSALDSDSEALLLAALERLMQGRTTFIIAHRLSTVRNADRVVVLEHGQVVETGKHRQLLASNGRYAHLHHLQNPTSRPRPPSPARAGDTP